LAVSLNGTRSGVDRNMPCSKAMPRSMCSTCRIPKQRCHATPRQVTHVIAGLKEQLVELTSPGRACSHIN
jgi:hypothetical protein